MSSSAFSSSSSPVDKLIAACFPKCLKNFNFTHLFIEVGSQTDDVSSLEKQAAMVLFRKAIEDPVKRAEIFEVFEKDSIQSYVPLLESCPIAASFIIKNLSFANRISISLKHNGVLINTGAAGWIRKRFDRNATSKDWDAMFFMMQEMLKRDLQKVKFTVDLYFPNGQKIEFVFHKLIDFTLKFGFLVSQEMDYDMVDDYEHGTKFYFSIVPITRNIS